MAPSDGLYLAIGLMSGTSMDGIDVAAIRTDGRSALQIGPGRTYPYDEAFRQQLRAVLGPDGMASADVSAVTRTLTTLHRDAVEDFLRANDLSAGEVDVIGFHGHTLHHDPQASLTCQIGDGAWLAEALGIRVVGDFRSRDVGEGGEGAPLVPVYHRALVTGQPGLELPVAVLNLGGIANVTIVNGTVDEDLMAFDCGPCNALLDDWMMRHTQQPFDKGGEVALSGTVDDAVLATLMRHPYFDAPPPKSLDRRTFNTDGLSGLSAADGAATLARWVGVSVARAHEHAQAATGKPISTWIACGGGRHNDAILAALEAQLSHPVIKADALGWDGDAIEAQAFAYLAVRTLQDMPITFPGTTGVSSPQVGGTVFEP